MTQNVGKDKPYGLGLHLGIVPFRMLIADTGSSQEP